MPELTPVSNTITDMTSLDIDQLRANLPKLDWGSGPNRDPLIDAYFAYYGLDFPGVAHFFGVFPAAGEAIAAHVFRPASKRATVIAVHGYYDHVGAWRHAIGYLTARGFTVAIYDQIGHGLSSGERAVIRDFSCYQAAFLEFLSLCRAHLLGPYHLIGHSMGAAVIVDALLRQAPPVDGVVLLAPLIRSAHWRLSRVVNGLFGLAVDSLPRVFRDNSSDPDFTSFVKHDPLQARVVPLQWFRSLARWYTDIQTAGPSDKHLRIIQGTSDKVVDWRYNLAFLEQRFPGAEINLLAGGGHQLINEAPVLRERVFELISLHLTDDTH